MGDEEDIRVKVKNSTCVTKMVLTTVKVRDRPSQETRHCGNLVNCWLSS